MREQGVREDNPEFIKTSQLIMAVRQQQAMSKLKQEQQQQQLQQQAALVKKRQMMSQQNAVDGQHLTNGVTGKLMGVLR